MNLRFMVVLGTSPPFYICAITPHVIVLFRREMTLTNQLFWPSVARAMVRCNHKVDKTKQDQIEQRLAASKNNT